MTDLAQLVLDEIAANPAALARLRELVGEVASPDGSTPVAAAYTVATLAAEVGRTERSIRAAIARGELQAVRRGRGYVIGADAVAAWTQGKRKLSTSARPRRSRPGRRSGLTRDQLKRAMTRVDET